MVIWQGDIWWADLPEPTGSAPGYRRPVLIVQGDWLNLSQMATAVCVPLTTNLRWARTPGNVLLAKRLTGLPKDSVAIATQIVTIDRSQLSECVGRLPKVEIDRILSAIDVMLGR